MASVNLVAMANLDHTHNLMLLVNLAKARLKSQMFFVQIVLSAQMVRVQAIQISANALLELNGRELQNNAKAVRLDITRLQVMLFAWNALP